MSKAQHHDINAHYINSVRNMPMLTHDEEYQLAKKWREEGDKKAVEALVASHLRLVAKIASGYRGYGLPVNDLISEGNIGMMQAMKHYDPDKGFRLSTYAMWWIKASIQGYILNTWSLVKMGTTAAQRKLFFNLRKEKELASTVFDDSHDLTPHKIRDIAQKLSVREDEVIQMSGRMSTQDHSLNAPISSTEGETSEWQDWLADDRETQEQELIERDEMDKRRALLTYAMQSLSPREQDILFARRLSDPPLKLDELAEKLNISRERVRQIEVKSFEKLQKSIRQKIAENY